MKFLLHRSQHSDKFTITNDTLDLDKDKITINPKSIVKIDPTTGAFKGTIIVDSSDELKLNHNSGFYTDYNSSIWRNIGPGLERNSTNKISIALGCQGVRFVNNRLWFDTSSLINNTSGSITVDDKERLELNYGNDFIKSAVGEIWLKVNEKHIVRTDDGNSLNIDDTIKYDLTTNKLSSNINKYLATGGDIYLNSSGKMKMNINKYLFDNTGTIFMSPKNRLTVNITDQLAGEIYLDTNNKLKLWLGLLFFIDSSGRFYPRINYDHGLDWENFKLNLTIDSRLSFVNRKLTLSYDPYFKITNNKLDLDITKLQTDTVVPKNNESMKLNHDGT